MDLLMYKVCGQSIKYDMHLEKVLGNELSVAFTMQREAKEKIQEMFKNVGMGNFKTKKSPKKKQSSYMNREKDPLMMMMAPHLK